MGLLVSMIFMFVATMPVASTDNTATITNLSDKLKGYEPTVGLTAGSKTDVLERPALILVGNVIKMLLTFVGVIFFVFVLYAGILWMTAGGNEEQISKAMKILFQSVVGLTIVIFAYAITILVVDILFGAQYPSDVGYSETYRFP